MPEYSFTDPRLFVTAPLGEKASIGLSREQSHYLLNVMRMREGGEVLLFNGRDGEWRATVSRAGRKEAVAEVARRTRQQTAPGRLIYCFAPLKQGRLDYMVQKAVEMGAARLIPVLTQHTQVRKVNLERLQANVVEAAEQCGVLHVPEVEEPSSLDDLMIRAARDGQLIFCDEREDGRTALDVLRKDVSAKGQLHLLVGPEGGFSQTERSALRALPCTIPLGLGPRILRADTAAVAAMTMVQACAGDWLAE